MRSKALIRLTAIVICLTTILTRASEPHTTAEVRAYASQLAQQYQDMGWFSGTLLLKRNGQPVLHQAYGFADIGSQRKNTQRTRYNLGSIAKLYTAVLVLKQVDQDQLALTDTLGTLGMTFAAPQSW